MTIKTSIYNTENILKVFEKDLRSGSSVKLQLNQMIRIFQIKNGGGLSWSKLSAEIPHCMLMVDIRMAYGRGWQSVFCERPHFQPTSLSTRLPNSFIKINLQIN